MTETPEERAKQTFDAWYQEDIQGSNQVPETLIATYALAIREAEERGRVQERAACAKIAMQAFDQFKKEQEAEKGGSVLNRNLQQKKQVAFEISATILARSMLTRAICRRAAASPTPEEKAREVISQYAATTSVGWEYLIAAAIREAVEKEREACADTVGFSNNASAAIRARSTASPTTEEKG